MKFLLIILVVYYILKLLSRYLFPIIIKKAVSNVQKNMNKQQAQQQDNTKVGETTVDYTPKSTSSSKNVGEYVDFEEVDNNKSKEK